MSRLRAQSIFHPHGFYPQGFGPTRILPELSKQLLSLQEQLQVFQQEIQQSKVSSYDTLSFYFSLNNRIADLSVTLEATPHGRTFATVLEGSYPALSLYENYIPKESRTGRFQLITPTSWKKNKDSTPNDSSSSSEIRVRQEMCRTRPIVILLAGTGEQGFQRRRHCVAYPLARLGIASLILESPYYGSRKPKSQHGSKLATLMDLPLLGRITIEETRSLVKWLRRQTNVDKYSNNDTSVFPLPQPSVADVKAVDSITAAALKSSDSFRYDITASSSSSANTNVLHPGNHSNDNGYGAIVLAGTSMGGLHAAMTASLIPYEVGVASWLGPASANPVFTKGCLALGTDWMGLCKDIHNSRINENIEEDLQEFEQNLNSSPYLKNIPHSLLPSPNDLRMVAEQCPNLPKNSIALALTQAARLLRITDVTNFTPPLRSDATIFVTAAHDQYVPLDETSQAMWNYIRNHWIHSDIRVIPGGHVTASLFALDTYVGTVVEVIRKLVRS